MIAISVRRGVGSGGGASGPPNNSEGGACPPNISPIAIHSNLVVIDPESFCYSASIAHTLAESYMLWDPFQHSAVACDIVWQVLYKFLHDMIWYGLVAFCSRLTLLDLKYDLTRSWEILLRTFLPKSWQPRSYHITWDLGKIFFPEILYLVRSHKILARPELLNHD